MRCGGGRGHRVPRVREDTGLMGAEVCVVKNGVHPRTLPGAWGRLLDRVSEGSWETERGTTQNSQGANRL